MSCGPDCQCGCCLGTSVVTPLEIANRPGLDQIAYRVGEHGSFLASMEARLSASGFPALSGLTARTPDDASIALLDAWATVADVLTFYQERIANEGYLRTATERRSVLELARLVGYEPRPGVSATVYLAYTVDDNAEGDVLVPAGARSQSVPGPGEAPQSFETSEKLIARREWNAIKPRLKRPPTMTSILQGSDEQPGSRVYLKGTSTSLSVNDPLLLQFGAMQPRMVRVTSVLPDDAAGHTLVEFAPWLPGDDVELPSDTQLRRALLRYVASVRQTAAESFAGKLLAAGAGFLLWFAQQASADPVAPDVAAVMGSQTLVRLILERFDNLRAAAAAAVSDSALAASALQISASLRSVPGDIDEFTGIEGGGSVGAKAVTAADALESAVSKRSDDDVFGRQEKQLESVMRGIVAGLSAPPSLPPRNSQTLERTPSLLFNRNSDVGVRAVAAIQPSIAASLSKAIARAEVTPPNTIRVFALRRKSLLFGATAPRKVTKVDKDSGVAETAEWSDKEIVAAESTTSIYLDAPYEKTKPESWVVMDFSAVPSVSLGKIQLPTRGLLIARAGQVNTKLARAAYGFSGVTTSVQLRGAEGGLIEWFRATGENDNATEAFVFIRQTAVYLESEELAVADEPVTTEICGGDQFIETDQLLSGLESGRWLIVAGERSDIPGTSGVMASELVMLEAAQQYVEKAPREASFTTSSTVVGGINKSTPSYLPGDKLHTYLKLARPLNYCYKRDTVAIYANVVKATNGETRNETLGSGDGTKPLQTFALKQPPLTFVPSPEPDGVSSTLRVYVNNVEWHEAEAIVTLGPNDRSFITRTDDSGVTSVTFGNGVRGARLPSGLENVKAIYRNGIGKGGNVKPGQITQLMTRPLGVKGVVNPLGASGGADRETRDSARRNAPMAVKALDRLVSAQDYADFSRTFAGIGKAASARVMADGNESVFVTIAGAEDIPIEKTSDLYQNLIAALRKFGDPYQPFRVELRELLMLVLSARIAIHPDYLWEDVVDRVRARLLDVFSFERRDLGESIALSEAIAVIAAVAGVAWVDVDAFGAVSQLTAAGKLRSPQEIAAELQKVTTADIAKGRPTQVVTVRGIRSAKQNPLPAQIAFFVPSLPETLILNRAEVSL